MHDEKETVRFMTCPDCGRNVPVQKLPADPRREGGPLTRVLWFARHLLDRAAVDQQLCRNSGRIASLVDDARVAA